MHSWCKKQRIRPFSTFYEKKKKIEQIPSPHCVLRTLSSHANSSLFSNQKQGRRNTMLLTFLKSKRRYIFNNYLCRTEKGMGHKHFFFFSFDHLHSKSPQEIREYDAILSPCDTFFYLRCFSSSSHVEWNLAVICLAGSQSVPTPQRI